MDVEAITAFADKPEVADQNYIDRLLNIDRWLTEYDVDPRI